MKLPEINDRSDDDSSGTDSQITDAIVEALSENDKVLEIRPAKESGGMGVKRLLLMGAGALGIAYWVRKSQKPNDLIGSVKEKTTNRSQEAAETIEAGSETASERIEEGSKRAGNAVRETGETVAEQTEEAGETASEKAESDDSGPWKS